MTDHRCHYVFGPFLLKPSEYELLRDGRPIALTPKTFETLVVLVQNHGRLLEKDELIRAVWHDTFVEEGNLCVTVSVLRKAMGEEHRFIQTVAKHGYRFVADVVAVPVAEAKEDDAATLVSAAMGSLVPLSALTPAASDPQSLEHTFIPTPLWRSPLGATALVIALGIVAVGTALWPRISNGSREEKDPEIRSLAVLPFENIGAKSGDEYLGLGVSDALITKLAGTKKVATRPTRAIQKYQNVSQDPRAVGREQNVDAILDGSVQRAGDRIRVTARLIRVGDGMQLWAATFDEDFTNLFAVEDAVSNRVANSIRLDLTGEQRERLSKHPTTNSEAYQSYLRGRYFWNERTGDGLKKGLDYFRRAIELDPTYAKAYAGIADSYAMLGLYTVLPPSDAFPKAKAAAVHALELDNTLAEAHATLGFVHFYYDWDGAAAEKEFATALDEDPNYAMAHSWRGFNLAVMGRLSEAMSEAKLAQAADPLSPIIGTNAAWVYFLARQNDQAIAVLQQIIEISPNFPRAHFRLGNIYEGEGRYRQAIEEYEKAVQYSDGDAYYQASLGHAYAMCGMITEAKKSLRHLEELSASRYVPPYAIALIYVGLGNKDHGLEWLERASMERSTSVAYLRVDPTLNSLRSEPRFAALVQHTDF